MIRSVTVYCSSSSAVAPVFVDAATATGRAIALNGWTLVYGGNPIGLMKCLADGARAAGGTVVGVTPQLFVDKNYHDTLAHELHVTANMRDRKAIMETRGDAFLTLPGGLGTFEEIFEILVGNLDVTRVEQPHRGGERHRRERPAQRGRAVGGAGTTLVASYPLVAAEPDENACTGIGSALERCDGAVPAQVFVAGAVVSPRPRRGSEVHRAHRRYPSFQTSRTSATPGR